MDLLYRILVITHVVLAFSALTTGTLAMILKKGSRNHIICGKWFYYTMITSLPLAIIICVLPNHWNPFLLSVGIFSFYFVISAKRAMLFKKVEPVLHIDKFLAITIIVTGLCMIFLPLIQKGSVNIILMFFGLASLNFGYSDWKRYRDISLFKRTMLKEHITKFMSAYIASITAFTVNVVSSHWIFWVAPGVLGGFLIGYWVKKYTGKSKKQTVKSTSAKIRGLSKI